jgi:RNA polymerase sigma factor (sigma-70 family)
MSTSATHGIFVDRIERHRGILFRVANAYCHGTADREDLIQETIVQLWRSYGRFDDRTSFSTWMYRIAVNVAISFYRSERRKRGMVSTEHAALEELPTSADPQPDERLTFLRELVERLDPLNRALMLLYLDDYPHVEIAAILGITPSNVATKIGRIKERLKRYAAGETR